VRNKKVIKHLPPRSYPSHPQGITLIELVIGFTIIVIVSLAVAKFLKFSQESFVFSETRSDVNRCVEKMHNILRKKDFNKDVSAGGVGGIHPPKKWGQYTVEAVVDNIDSHNIRRSTITVRWNFKGHPQEQKTVVNLTNEGGDKAPTGKIYAQAFDSNGDSTPGYQFVAIPYFFPSGLSIADRAGAKESASVDPVTERAEFELQVGQWFIFPVGRAGTIQQSYVAPQSYRSEGTVSKSEYSYPAVVRRWDYDFADSPGTLPTDILSQSNRKTLARAMMSQSLSDEDVPIDCPYSGNLFTINEGETYNDVTATSKWNNPNHDGTLVYKVSKAGSLSGKVKIAHVGSSPPVFLDPAGPTAIGVDGAVVEAIFFPECIYDSSDGTLNQFTLLTMGTMQPFLINGPTYLSRNFYGGLFKNSGPHQMIPLFAWNSLNKPDGAFMKMSGLTWMGNYSIFSGIGGLALPGWYGTSSNKFLTTVKQSINVQLKSLPAPYVKSDFLQGVRITGSNPNYTLENSLGTDFTITNKWVESGRRWYKDAVTGVDTNFDFDLVPVSALASIRVRNTKVGQETWKFSLTYPAYVSNTWTSASVDSTLVGPPPQHVAETSKNVIPSASSSETRSFSVYPEASSTLVNTTVKVVGDVVHRTPKGITTPLPGATLVFIDVHDDPLPGGGNNLGSTFEVDLTVDESMEYTYTSFSETIKPNEVNEFSFDGFGIQNPNVRAWGVFSHPLGYVSPGDGWYGVTFKEAGTPNKYEFTSNPITMLRVYQPTPFTITVVKKNSGEKIEGAQVTFAPTSKFYFPAYKTGYITSFDLGLTDVNGQVDNVDVNGIPIRIIVPDGGQSDGVFEAWKGWATSNCWSAKVTNFQWDRDKLEMDQFVPTSLVLEADNDCSTTGGPSGSPSPSPSPSASVSAPSPSPSASPGGGGGGGEG